MLTETEVKAKTDTELLEIWEHQNDYVTEMVTRVKAEIERRNLDTSGIHVVTLEEIEAKKEAGQTRSDRRWARATALLNGAVGLSGVFSLHSDESLVVSIVGLVLALLLIVVSIGVWMRKKWALISGLLIYGLLAVTMIAGTIAQLIIRRSGESLRKADPSGFLALFVCLFMAVIFNGLRKRAGVKEASRSN